MKLAIVRQTYNPNGGAERFVSRALNVLAQDTALDVTLIARQWEDAAGWKTLTVNPAFRNRLDRESGFADAAAAQFAQFDIVQSHERIPGATIFRAGDGVHATWLAQYNRIQSPLARWAQSLSRIANRVLPGPRRRSLCSSISCRVMSVFPGQPFSAPEMAYTPPGLSSTTASSRRWRAGRSP